MAVYVEHDGRHTWYPTLHSSTLTLCAAVIPVVATRAKVKGRSIFILNLDAGWLSGEKGPLETVIDSVEGAGRKKVSCRAASQFHADCCVKPSTRGFAQQVEVHTEEKQAFFCAFASHPQNSFVLVRPVQRKLHKSPREQRVTWLLSNCLLRLVAIARCSAASLNVVLRQTIHVSRNNPEVSRFARNRRQQTLQPIPHSRMPGSSLQQLDL
ncbi:predicted protein [Histoplasma mississippiense (nom. inval.)]|uniref:predicted protein n=1 Tax=Ajellomyces capsulatus (strain NAm1 / WU24) TaxID=2059318 RepID=UPI000157BA28|nr:predicted protein [Histoplasma mississippiense (nom. inval.)]EDN03396.1 predicted protein [Histoplasma mississippiense (nom. inval.)]